MSDTSSVRSSSRASTLMNRPQSSPMGPRTRQTSTRSSTPLDHKTRSELNALDLTEFGGKPLTSSSPAPISPMSSQSMPSSVRRSLQPVSEEALHQVRVYDPETSTQASAPPSDTDALSTSGARAAISALGEPASPASVAPWQMTESVREQVEEVPTYIAQRQEIPEELHSPNSIPHDSRFPSDVDPDSEPQSPIIVPSHPPLQEPVAQDLPEETTQPKVITPPPQKSTFPAPIKFESAPVSWKGLPLDAVLWTVDSGELQDIVSRAIRASASESFVRLLTPTNLDSVLPAELARLESLKAVTQSKYRFLVHRRTMLFQALNSTSLGQQKDGEDGVSVVSRLASQLADTIGECDQNLAEVIAINDQITQINKLIDIHWSSALAIALRKLNGSYARRTNDLATAKERITQLEAELKDAWKEAERMAQELDDYEAAIVADDTEAVIETAEVVAVPKPSVTHSRRTSVPMSPTLLELSPTTSTRPQSPISPASPGISNFVFPPIVHLKAKETEAVDVPDTVSIRSNRSGKSHRSAWTAESNNVSAVHAAKKRSDRASQSSLRLNTGHGKKHSEHRSRTPYDDQPPLPDLPVRFTPFNGMMNAGSASASSTLLNNFDPNLRRQVSLDSVRTGASRHGPSAYQGRRAAVDDLYIRSRQINRKASKESEIQLVPRAASRASTTQNFASMFEHHSSRQSSTEVIRPKVKDPSKTIPSMWMNVDAVRPNKSNARPKSSQARLQPEARPSPPPRSPSDPSTSSPSSVENPSGMSHGSQPQTNKTARNSTYEKIRGLTKRYSVSLPMFNSQTRLASRRSG